ncbi:hypothetical protein AB0C27_18535 [Nonomuraea sp. NPDC048882]|uniref:hypothetical protein n=1 Tax=Nonomuraea sp. NPDC048882 TaxID=3154347 RepID=UPI000AD1002D
MRLVTIVLLGALVLVAGVMVPTMWVNLSDLRAAEAAAAEATVAAKKVAPELLSYDYRTIEEDLARAGTFTTGDLTGHYKELSKSLASRAKAQKIVQTVDVTDVGVEHAEPGRVEVLLFMNTGTVKEIPGKEGLQREFTQNRARFVMVRQESRWLVAGLSTLLGTA